MFIISLKNPICSLTPSCKYSKPLATSKAILTLKSHLNASCSSPAVNKKKKNLITIF